MKTIRSGLSSVVALAALAGLVVLLVGLFSTANSNSVGPNTSPVATLIGQISPLATPNVPLARIGSPVLLQASGPLGLLNQAADKFVNIGGENGTILLDPTNGLTRTLATTGLVNARVSDSWLVYEDRPSLESSAYYSRIKAVDLNTGRELMLGGKDFYQRRPSISGNIVVWEDWRNQATSGLDIYGYDLTTGKEFPVVVKDGPSSDARISGQWVTYIEPTGRAKYLAQLRAHSLKTGEDYAIGIIPAPNTANSGTYHAFDGDKIAWVEALADGQYELHLHDLTTKTDRSLTEAKHQPPTYLSLSAKSGIVVYYDDTNRRIALDWFQPTPAILSSVPPVQSQWGYQLSVVGDYLVWQIPRGSDYSDGQVFVSRISR